MSYSVDPNANRDDPNIPSSAFGVNDQIIYKLAALDALLQSGFINIRSDIARIQKDLLDHKTDLTVKIREVEVGLEKDLNVTNAIVTANSLRITTLERWKDVQVTRLAMIGTGLFFLFTLISPAVERVAHTIIGIN